MVLHSRAFIFWLILVSFQEADAFWLLLLTIMRILNIFLYGALHAKSDSLKNFNFWFPSFFDIFLVPIKKFFVVNFEIFLITGLKDIEFLLKIERRCSFTDELHLLSIFNIIMFHLKPTPLSLSKIHNNQKVWGTEACTFN